MLIEVSERIDPARDASWSRSRREAYLLDERTATPLSVDEAVWPSAGTDDRRIRLAVLGFNPELETGEPDDGSYQGWPIIGYDVVDDGMISAVSNCGYTQEEKAQLSEWLPRLNQWGLLATRAWADGFVAIANERVPEHAPFYVVELRSPDLT